LEVRAVEELVEMRTVLSIKEIKGPKLKEF